MQWIWRFWSKLFCKVWGSHSSLSEDLDLLEYEALSLGNWLSLFRRNGTASYPIWLNLVWNGIGIWILMKSYDFLLMQCVVIIWLSLHVLVWELSNIYVSIILEIYLCWQLLHWFNTKNSAGYAQSYKLIITSGSFTVINRNCVHLYPENIGAYLHDCTASRSTRLLSKSAILFCGSSAPISKCNFLHILTIW